jgi:hypothetical protein
VFAGEKRVTPFCAILKKNEEIAYFGANFEHESSPKKENIASFFYLSLYNNKQT